METIKYLEDELKSVGILLRMLQNSSDRMDNGKEVPPWMLKENMELLQVYIDGSHITRELLILDRIKEKGIHVPLGRIYDDHKILHKYQRFLQSVIEAYDLGYRGAMGAFPHYCRDYIRLIEDHIDILHEVLRKSEDYIRDIDEELLNELKMIDERLKRIRQRGEYRMEILIKEFRKVAA
ncbi:MAG: hypothetical protein JW984_09750 [Deltaproteobacteria bacterium]|uniref:Hemerythrin-like domain-containing protein n=1 Tax=Candidatus Zymogenus saltonus TaxID=2844893 RepID=A0A9D8KFZ7_9DELT|nr:hypothetical protein [Candidatus Zymogenus saltonus]